MANITELVCNVNEIVYVGDRFEFNRISLTVCRTDVIMSDVADWICGGIIRHG